MEAELGRGVRRTVDANVAAVLEPLDEHLETVVGELVAQLCGFYILVAEI